MAINRKALPDSGMAQVGEDTVGLGERPVPGRPGLSQ